MTTDDMTAQVMHAIGKGVQKLRAEHADAEDRVRCLEADGRTDAFKIDRLESSVAGLTEHRDKLVKERSAAQNRAGEWEGKFNDKVIAYGQLMGRYDSMTLGLYRYMVFLAGETKTAKTKAERLALGHVLGALAGIRPPVSKAEADELGLLWDPEAAS